MTKQIHEDIHDRHTRREKLAQGQPSLPANQAFVVQFRAEAGQGRGRVEHISSHQVTCFESWTELQDFVVRMLAQVRDRPP